MRQTKKYQIVFGIMLMIVVLGCLSAAGYGLTTLIYLFTKRPPEVWAHIFSSFAGFLLIAAVVSLVKFISRHSDGYQQHQSAHNQLLHAMKKIAQGNFDVFIDTKDDFIHRDIAEEINQIAKNLGTLEKLRQDFISDVSHEIQSPLTSISGFAALLRGDGISKEEIDHYAVIIEAESRRLSKLSDNLLKLSTLETDGMLFEMNEFRLDKQIKHTLLILEPQWVKKNLSPEVSLSKTMVRGNADLLSQVWINLLHNAIKFTPDGGVIRIALTEKNGEIHCTISDNGIGIPKEDQIHIFERFYKVDKSRDRALGGNGLGLSLVKKIVELHSGSVAVESEEEKSTTFTVLLPIRSDMTVSK